ncbi:MAG: M66 family metalloprotease [Gemmatimonadales bacterium]
MAYSAATGGLTVTIAGLPGGAPAGVTVTGPGGFSQTLTATATLTGLAPGTYSVAAAGVTSGGYLYQAAPGSQTAAVTAGATIARTVTYAATGKLTVTVSGLPGGTPAAITVTGPGGFSQSVTATTTLSDLAPGTYTVAAAGVTGGTTTYAPSPASQTAAVTGAATASRTVAYSATTGSLTVTIAGLPGGAIAAVTVTGPGSFSQTLTATTTLGGLAPGTYTIAAATVTSGGFLYQVSPASQSAAVVVGTTVSKTVTYAATGKLTVTVAGLPGGTPAAITVTGPAGYSQSVTATTTLSDLAPGTYTVAAAGVTGGATTYTPSPASQTAAVTGAATVSRTVTYSGGGGSSLNLTIAGMYLTQAIAAFDGTTKLVAGRDAHLRVFVVANQANTAAPAVRVRLYSGATLVQTSTITAPGASVPTAVNEGSLGSSWNLAVPGSLVQPNLRVLADVDPTNVIAESSDTDNSYPVSGTPFTMDVHAVPNLVLRMVPVLQSVNGLQGNVTTANLASYLIDPLKLLPVAAYSAGVRAVYTTNAPALQSSNGNGAWGTILSEVSNLRFTDGHTDDYYFGVVKVSYGSGVSGIGYVGGGARTALSWDKLPGATSTVAHELGHNMSLPHAPCGNPTNPDPAFPYAGGGTGVWGLDLTSLTLKDPATQKDFMTYCTPEWVSDYNWNKMIAYRESDPHYAPPAPLAATAGLLVWGRITAAGIVLEPALRVPAPAAAPRGTGRYRVQALSASGQVVADYPVDPVPVSNERETELHFAAVVPLTDAMEQSLVRVRLIVPGGVPAERVSLQALAQGGGRLFFRDPAATMTPATPVQTRIAWDAATYPMAMIRDAATGEVLSFARGGAIDLWTASRRFDVTFSDGVRSVGRRVQ